MFMFAYARRIAFALSIMGGYLGQAREVHSVSVLETHDLN